MSTTDPPTTTDKPRLIVVCHPSIFPEVQRAVSKLGLGDVLVKPNKYVEEDKVYVMPNPDDLVIE